MECHSVASLAARQILPPVRSVKEYLTPVDVQEVSNCRYTLQEVTSVKLIGQGSHLLCAASTSGTHLRARSAPSPNGHEDGRACVGVIAIFIWALVVMNHSLAGPLFPYAPTSPTLPLPLFPVSSSARQPSVQHNVKGGAALPFAAATLLLVGVAVFVSVLAARTTMRRDVA